MPGPRNQKKARKAQAQKERKRTAVRGSLENITNAHIAAETSLPPHPAAAADVRHEPPAASPKPVEPALTPPPTSYHATLHTSDPSVPHPYASTAPPSPFGSPCIEDQGTGPRVRDAHTFITSSFAHPPSLDDPLCVELAQPEVLDMLLALLPADLALVSPSPDNFLSLFLSLRHSISTDKLLGPVV